MSKSAALLRRTALFLLGYTVLCIVWAMRLPYETGFQLSALTLGSAILLAPVGLVLLFFIVVWTAVTHGAPTIQSESEGSSFLVDDDNLKVSMTGEPMRNGVDLSGNPYGLHNND